MVRLLITTKSSNSIPTMQRLITIGGLPSLIWVIMMVRLLIMIKLLNLNQTMNQLKRIVKLLRACGMSRNNWGAVLQFAH